MLDLDRAWGDAEGRHDAATLKRILDDRFVCTFDAGKLNISGSRRRVAMTPSCP